MAIWDGSTALPVFAAGQKITASQLTVVTDALHGATDAETAYAPTLRYGTTAWVPGNASVDVTYRRASKKVEIVGRIITGSTTTYGGAVTGLLSISLPVAARRAGQAVPVGIANIVDTSAGVGYQCQVYLDSTSTQALFLVATPSASAGITMATAAGTGNPFTFANTDQIKFEFEYEAA